MVVGFTGTNHLSMVRHILYTLVLGAFRLVSSLLASSDDNDDTGQYTDERGYHRYTHNHQLVHRAVMEQKFGRKLRREEVVHHKDRNKQNNHPSNLWVFKNQAEHDAQHKRDARKYGEWWSYNGSRR